MTNAATGERVLGVRELRLGYGRQDVLAGVNLEVRAGEFWFLLGPNGSGKSTLLKAILGLLAPRAGRIDRHSELAGRERLGFVPQQCRLNPSLPTTIREFVSLGFVGTRVPRGQRTERLGWALARAGLEGRDRSDYWSLSGGQRQRALVARALVRRPGLMILDEPTEGLDLAAEEAFLQTLADLNRSDGMTLLFVTHKLSIAPRYATHAALFHGGTVSTGPRDSALRREEIERVFGVSLDLEPARPGEPPANAAPAS